MSGGSLNDYARRIVELFAEDYPSSAQFRGGRKLRKAGWGDRFPEITGDVAAKEEFLRGIEALAAAGVVSVKWKRFREGDEAEALYLEDPDKLFGLTDIRDPKEVREEMLGILRGRRGKTEACVSVREALTAKLEAYHDIPVSRPDELRDMLRLFELSPEAVRGRTIRALSVLLFSDSKRIEFLLPGADKIGRSVVGTGLSGLLGLSRTYPEAGCCLRGSIVFLSMAGGKGGGAERVWETDYTHLSLPLETIEEIGRIEFGDGNTGVLSVENKETFFAAAATLKGRFSGFIYTGGYPNRAVKKLLAITAASGCGLYHFGDLDPEGVSIFFDVEAAAGVSVRPFLMSAEIYRRYASYGYRLGRPAISKHGSKSDYRFPELLAEIGRTGLGVEQEIIDLTDSPL